MHWLCHVAHREPRPAMSQNGRRVWYCMLLAWKKSKNPRAARGFSSACAALAPLQSWKNLKSITSCLSYKRQSKDEWHKSVVMRESTDNLLCLQYYSSFQIHYLFNICNHPTHRYFLINGALWPPLSLPVNLSKVSYLVSRGEWMRTQAWCQPKPPLTKLTAVELRGRADSNNPVIVKEISSKSDHPAARGNDNCHVFNLDTYFSRRKPVMLMGNRVVCLRSRLQTVQ